MIDLAGIDPDRPVLIAGPTASGKSALALAIAEAQGGLIVNADALQVYGNWRVLTARPSEAEIARAPHRLYGHIDPLASYSAGHWLREVTPLLTAPERVIVVGGTGLNFMALTQGLAPIPDVPGAVRAQAITLSLETLVAQLDPETAARIDLNNPARVRRAWEVLRASGQGLAQWQDRTPPPVLPLTEAQAIVMEAPKEWLEPRIAKRFDRMVADGALDEVRRNMQDWDPTRPSARAIGAPELRSYLLGEITLDAARDQAVVATRQYAKRQRTWFRARMRDWHWVSPETRPYSVRP